MERRTIRQIKQDLRCYLDLYGLLRQAGDREAAAAYLRHVKAMERELELRRTGYVLTTG